MNYCTIQEAWGRELEQFTDNDTLRNDTDLRNTNKQFTNNNKHLTNNNKHFTNNELFTNNDNINDINNDNNNNLNIFENSTSFKNNNNKTQTNFNKNNKSYNINYNGTCDCDLLLEHIKSCPKCYNKIKSEFSPKIIEYYHNILSNNKDIITLILIGLFIILFFKLINNITK